KAQSCLYLRGWTNPDRERPLQGDPQGGSELPILESRTLADDDQSRHQVFSGDSDNPARFRSSGDTMPNCLGEFREIRESKERTRGAKRANHVITLAPKKLILTRRASEGSASEPSLARRVSMCKDAKLSCRGNTFVPESGWPLSLFSGAAQVLAHEARPRIG